LTKQENISSTATNYSKQRGRGIGEIDI